jgi:nicotinamidase/pyrazinamidase
MQENPNILFFDVDTQSDFIEKTGALYVPEAETLKSNFKVLIEYARQLNIPVWGSVDAHLAGDPELIQNQGPFPNHCMLGETGQQKIQETTPLNPLWIENHLYSAAELSKFQKHPHELYFQKQSFDVFDNPNLIRLIAPFDPIIVFGVATDYCVLAAVRGFRKLEKIVLLVTDAIKAVNIKPDDGQKALDSMQRIGAIFINTNDVLSGNFLSDPGVTAGTK